jgi:hypothetical protein
MQRAKSSTPSIVCLRARAPMPGAVATTAHLATIVIANLAHLATEASPHIAANMGGHGIPGGERRNGIHAVTTSSTGTGNNAGIAGITHRDGAIIREGTGSAPIRPISGGAGVTTEYVRPSPTAARLLPGAKLCRECRSIDWADCFSDSGSGVIAAFGRPKRPRYHAFCDTLTAPTG